MRKYWLALAFVAFSISAVFAQTPTPTTIPAEEDDVVKISTNLIQVDVTVTDKNGKIINDLKPEEFEIYENKKKQDITNFSFVKTATDSTALSAEEKPKKIDRNSILPSSQLKPEQVRRTIALVVDDLGLSFESIYYVRRALRKFVDEQMQPNDLVAIIRTGSGISALQQFTSDKRQLYAAIEAVKWNALGRAGISAFAPVQSTTVQSNSSDEDTDEEAENEAESVQGFNDFRDDIFSIGTLGAINFIVRGMRELPGRKSVMLFSDGFVVCTAQNPDRCARMVDSVRRLTDLSNRAAVSIYTFDARGLQYTGVTAADDTGNLSAQQMQNLMSSRSMELFDKQGGLAYLAEETGGRTFFNNNDLNRGLEKALEDQKGYYLIGYQPDDETFDPKTRRFNKLEIKVKRKGATVRYRSGFFGIADTDIKKPTTQTPAQQILSAISSPFVVSEISLRLNTLFGNDKQSSYVRSLLHVKASDLKFTDETDGNKKAVFDVLAINFGENGTVIDQISKTYTWTIKSEVYQKLLDEGFVYHFTFPVKKPGAYQYRVAIRDSNSGKVGSANQFIEIPNLKKNRLTVSSIVLENLTIAQYQKNNNAVMNDSSTAETYVLGNSMSDTSLRQFKRGTILRYGYEIYNAKLDATQKPNLTAQAKVFRDGKPLLEGKITPIDLTGQTDFQHLKSVGGLTLGAEMQPGEYVLQISITDNLVSKKRQVATQFILFEIME